MSEDLCFDMAIEDAQRAGSWSFSGWWRAKWLCPSCPKMSFLYISYEDLCLTYQKVPIPCEELKKHQCLSLPGISAVWMGSRGNGAFYPVQAAQLREDDPAGGKHTDSTDETSQTILKNRRCWFCLHLAAIKPLLSWLLLHANSPWKPIHMISICRFFT